MASRRVSIAYASRWRRVLARIDMSFTFRISVHASSGSVQRQRSLPIEAPTHCDAGCQSVSTGGADRERSSSAAPCRTEHLKVTTSRPIDVLPKTPPPSLRCASFLQHLTIARNRLLEASSKPPRPALALREALMSAVAERALAKEGNGPRQRPA